MAHPAAATKLKKTKRKQHLALKSALRRRMIAPLTEIQKSNNISRVYWYRHRWYAYRYFGSAIIGIIALTDGHGTVPAPLEFLWPGTLGDIGANHVKISGERMAEARFLLSRTSRGLWPVQIFAAWRTDDLSVLVNQRSPKKGIFHATR